MNDLSSIAIITKLRTPNAGNEALSTELIRSLRDSYPSARIYVGWREPGLERYSFKKLQQGGPNPLRTLDTWADSVIKQYSFSKEMNSECGRESSRMLQLFKIPEIRSDLASLVKLGTVDDATFFQRVYRKGIRISKALFEHTRWYGNGYEPWLNVLEHSNVVIYSPAGEQTNARADYFLRDWLGLRIAQKLGARVKAINQSIEIDHPLLLKLLGQLYSTFEAVVVRDPVSVHRLLGVGLQMDRITLAPDTAFLAQPVLLGDHKLDDIARRENIKPGAVGINITAETIRVDSFLKGSNRFLGWGSVIRQLQALDKQVVFVSNQMSPDKQIGIELEKLFGVTVLSRQYNYEEYIYVLSLLDMVISERYHTCVFSAIANKPFISLTTGTVKQSGLNHLFLNYQVPLVYLSCAGWDEAVMTQVRYISNNYERITSGLKENMPRLRKMAKHNAQ